MLFRSFQTVKKHHKGSIWHIMQLNWSFIVIFSFWTKLAINFHKHFYFVAKVGALNLALGQAIRRSRTWDCYLVVCLFVCVFGIMCEFLGRGLLLRMSQILRSF